MFHGLCYSPLPSYSSPFFLLPISDVAQCRSDGRMAPSPLLPPPQLPSTYVVVDIVVVSVWTFLLFWPQDVWLFMYEVSWSLGSPCVELDMPRPRPKCIKGVCVLLTWHVFAVMAKRDLDMSESAPDNNNNDDDEGLGLCWVWSSVPWIVSYYIILCTFFVENAARRNNKTREIIKGAKSWSEKWDQDVLWGKRYDKRSFIVG